MSLTNFIILLFIFFGAVIMLMSAAYTKKIFVLLPDNNLKSNWEKLRVLMFVFFIGYIAVGGIVIIGETKLLALFSGVIFFMGALFVFLVVRTGLDSFNKLKKLHENLDDTELKNKELEQFAHITSHDLKTPLRGVSSLASFIKEDLDSGKIDLVNDHLINIQEQVERLENLINGILHYSKIGKINAEAVNLNTIVEVEFKNYHGLKNIKFIKQNELPIVNGDMTQLIQVVSNLISNSIKHNDKNICEINISSIEKSNYYEIIFEDNGPGIDVKYHHKIFEVFQTLTSNTSYENTGIGLSIVKKIIEKHQASIKVISNGVMGTKFSISYPKNLIS